MKLDFSNFPVLTTERLLLRQLTDEDAEQIHQLRSDPSVNAFIDRTHSTGVEDAKKFISTIIELVKKAQGIYWGICLKENSGLIGTVCYWNFDIKNEIAEIGYELLPEFQGKGIMTEAIKRVIEYGFEEMKVKAITAFPSVDNLSSIALLLKAKFSIAGNPYNPAHENVNNMATYILKRDHSV